MRDADGAVEFRPTCHYAYHPCNDAVLSFHELFGAGGRMPDGQHVLDEDEIVDGRDELGVLLYGHARNAYWFGSQLTIEEARQLAPHQNATGLQVTSAVLAGIVWALENPDAGIVETDDMDHERCLEVQLPYLGTWPASTPTGPRSPTARACSTRTSTPTTRGSSATSSCTDADADLPPIAPDGLRHWPDGTSWSERTAWRAAGGAPRRPTTSRYHDDEWGYRRHVATSGLFEKLCLEGFQSGLSWLTILRKRDNFRAAFAGFDPASGRRFDEADVERLLGDAGIVRHGGKIRSTINNAAPRRSR